MYLSLQYRGPFLLLLLFAGLARERSSGVSARRTVRVQQSPLDSHERSQLTCVSFALLFLLPAAPAGSSCLLLSPSISRVPVRTRVFAGARE